MKGDYVMLHRIFYIQGEPCYPLKYLLFDTFSFMYRKRALMKSRGWYKSLSGDWCGRHLEFLSHKDFKKMNYDELEKFIS